MLDIKKDCKEIFDTALVKFKELKDQKEIGKCIRALIVTSGIGYAINLVIKNGGINYNNKLFICSTPNFVNQK